MDNICPTCEDLKALLESINQHVIPGEVDSIDGAVIELKRLREENKRQKVLINQLCDALDQWLVLVSM